MNETEFYKELDDCSDMYDQDNQWFGFKRGGPRWSRGTWEEFMVAAWKIYDKVTQNQLQLILLGDTKIRSNASLVMNFGLSSNSKSPQESGDQNLVNGLMAQRARIAKGANKAVKVMGPGSILSAQRWSPALNDTFMLGGIKKRQGFHFALNSDEQIVWNKLTVVDKVQPSDKIKNIANKYGNVTPIHQNRAAPDIKDTWLKFFQKVPRLLWENGAPRVFARELIGLKLFGYKPVFSHIELGFTYDYTSQWRRPTFKNYLNGLRDVGFQTPDKEKIIRDIAQYLFDDANALDQVQY